MSKKEFYQIGNAIYLLNEVEVALLTDLDKKGLLKFNLQKIQVYETKNKAE